MDVNRPIIVGATGGSGTRVLARILRLGGLFIGTNLNRSEDAMDFPHYYDRWINTYLSHMLSRLPANVHSSMSKELDVAIRKHLSPMDPAQDLWGWKSPRSIYLLPFFHSRFPAMKFVHFIRDGRDMSFSNNQNQLDKHGRVLLTPEEKLSSRPVQSIALWSRINLIRAEYGESMMKDQYLRIRFEDLCRNPVQITQKVFDFAGLRGNAEKISQEEIVPPKTLGRWRNENPEIKSELNRVAKDALQKFGYFENGDSSQSS